MGAVLVGGAIGPLAGVDLVDVGVFFLQVGIGDVDGHIVVRAPGGTQAEDLAVVSGDARRAELVAGRGLVVGQACTQGPLAVQLVGGTHGIGPGVAPVLLFGDVAEGGRQASGVFNADFFQAAPAGPGATGVECPGVVQVMGDGEVDGFRGFQVQGGVVLAGQGAEAAAAEGGVTFQLV